MTDDDDDSYRTTAAEETPPYMKLRKRHPSQLHPSQTVGPNKKRSSPTPTIKSQLPVTLRRLEPMQRHIRNQLKGCDVDRNLSLRVLSASHTMQKDYLVTKSKKKGKKVSPPAIRSRILQVFGISPNTLQSWTCIFVIVSFTSLDVMDKVGQAIDRRR